MLTPHQSQKEDEVIAYIKEGKKIILVAGSAGTGKTFMVNHLIRRIKAQCYQYGVVYVTAPTHKALSVLKTKIEPEQYIEFKTIHSGLQLKRKFIAGEQVFVKPDRYNPRYPPFARGVLLICDEASMIGNAEISDGDTTYRGMLDLIEEFQDQMTLIFLGDIKQLNPVNEDESPVFTKDYPRVTLTEIKRQGEGSPIIELSNDLQLIWKKKDKLITVTKTEIIKPKSIDGEEVTEELVSTKQVKIGYTFTADRERIVTRLAQANGTNEYKYLAYTNEDVDAMNRSVRNRIYGMPNKIEVGEILIFNRPYRSYMNNEEIKVNTLQIIEKDFELPTAECMMGEIDGQLAIKNRDKRQNGRIIYDENKKTIPTYQTVKLKCYLINDSIIVTHEEADMDYGLNIKMLEREARKGEMDYKAKYYFQEQAADLTYAHAITVHKSQGSTYEKVFVNVANLAKCRNHLERKRLTYTAVTRASEMVILFNVR